MTPNKPEINKNKISTPVNHWDIFEKHPPPIYTPYYILDKKKAPISGALNFYLLNSYIN